MTTEKPRKVDIASKLLLRSRQSKKFGYDSQRLATSSPDSFIQTNRSGSAYGKGLRSTALITLNIAVLAPIPNARVTIAMIVSVRCFSMLRRP
jgi:hypothetical protein